MKRVATNSAAGEQGGAARPCALRLFSDHDGHSRRLAGMARRLLPRAAATTSVASLRGVLWVTHSSTPSLLCVQQLVAVVWLVVAVFLGVATA